MFILSLVLSSLVAFLLGGFVATRLFKFLCTRFSIPMDEAMIAPTQVASEYDIRFYQLFARLEEWQLVYSEKIVVILLISYSLSFEDLSFAAVVCMIVLSIILSLFVSVLLLLAARDSKTIFIKLSEPLKKKT